MCNYSHPDAVPIPSFGIGWKIFAIYEGQLKSMVNLEPAPRIGEKMEWDRCYGGDGFCFFHTEKAAKGLLRRWGKKRTIFGNTAKYFILRIRYWQGLEKHIEDKIVNNYEAPVCLCKAYQIMEDQCAKV